MSKGHIIGFCVGLCAAAGGFIAYKKNQEKVDSFLKSKGIIIPGSSSGDTSRMSMEELLIRKEELEDLIAEREYAAKQEKPAKE